MKYLLLTITILAVCADPRQSVHAAEAPKAAQQCDLTIKLQPQQRRLEASGTLRLPPAKQPRESIELSLRNDMADLRIEVLAPRESAGPAEVREKGAPERDRDRTWTVRPQHPFPADAEITLKFSYSGGSKQSLVFCLNQGCCFAGGPNSAWFPEFDSGSSTGSLRFEVPKGMVVKATGNQIRNFDEGDSSVFEFSVTTPSMYSFAAGKYTIRRHEGRVPTTLYLFKDRPFAEEMVAGLGKVMDVLVREFGPYPYGKEFAIVETPSPLSELSGFTGASIEGFMFVSTGALQGGFNLALFGHELSHQWWGNLVKQSGAKGSYMMDEAMAQYGSLRCVEELEGPEAAARYRRTGYPRYSSIQCGRGALQLWAKGIDHELDSLPIGINSHNLADSKGFLVYHLLARTIGPDRLRKAFQQIVEKHAFGRVSWEEFTQTIEKVAGQDLGWFYDQWFKRTGAPVLSLEWVQEKDKVRCTIQQEEPTYRLTIPVRIEFTDQKPVTHDIEIRTAKTEFTLPASAKVSTVVLDPLYHVHHMTPQIKAELKKK
jgi:hypothetical protein